MKRRLALFVSSLLLCSAPLAGRAVAMAPEDLTRASAVTVASTVGTHRGNGAGVVLAVSGTTVRILTVKHVATFGTAITVAVDGSEPVPGTLVYTDPARDLAVIDAQVSETVAAAARPVQFGTPRSLHQGLHLWGESHGVLGVERGDVEMTGATLPDGPAAGRFAFACTDCHQGDSGAGVFTDDGTLVGIYLGFYMEDGRQGLSVAAAPAPVVAFAKMPGSGAPATIATLAAPLRTAASGDVAIVGTTTIDPANIPSER